MSSWTVVLDPSAVADGRAELDLNADPIGVESIDWGDAAIQEYVSDQVVGSSIVDFRIPNRTVTIGLMLGSGVQDQEAGRAKLQQKVALLQREGGWLLRQRHGGDPMYADIVNATLTLPDVWGETGDVEPDVKLALECKPDFYGDEITLETLAGQGGDPGGHMAMVLRDQNSNPAVIAGDHPGRVRIIVQNGQGQDEHSLLYAFRSRYYDPDPGAALFLEAEDATYLQPWGAGAVTSLTGASGGSVIQATLSVPQGSSEAILTNVPWTLKHLGAYRVLARVYTPSDARPSLQMTWGAGASFNQSNDWVQVPATGGFYLVDLGMVNLRRSAVAGSSHSWSFSLNARPTSGSETDVVGIDCFYFIPLDDFSGRAEQLTTVNASGAMKGGLNTELRTEGAYQQMSSTEYQRASAEFGDLPRIPVSGLEGRPVELFIRPSRQALDIPDPQIGTNSDYLDNFIVQVIYRPCWLGRP